VTYDREAIMRWLETRRVDPTTKVPMRRRQLVPNLSLRSVIDAWLVQHRTAAANGSAHTLKRFVYSAFSGHVVYAVRGPRRRRGFA
jgi:U-box domain